MNNEDKILAVLEQLQQGQAATNTRLDKMDTRLDKMDTRLDRMDTRLDKIEEDIAEIKEHAEITRVATNALVEWADTVGVITQVGFPVKK